MLSRTQQNLLAEMATGAHVCREKFTRHCWLSTQAAFRARAIRVQTLDALVRSGYIGIYHAGMIWDTYAITDTGRCAIAARAAVGARR